MKEKLATTKKYGMPVLLITLLLYLAAIGLCIYGGILLSRGHSPLLLIVSIVWLCLGWIPLCGLKVLKPQEALVLTLFGKYVGNAEK
jgi:hypothetical protein